MNDIERAIKYMAEAIKETDEDFSECSGRLKEELAEQRQDFETAIQALQEKAARESPVPLTLEQLKERTKPAWVKCDVENGGYWCLCNQGVIITPSGNCYDVEDIPNWEFCDHEPKEV